MLLLTSVKTAFSLGGASELTAIFVVIWRHRQVIYMHLIK